MVKHQMALFARNNFFKIIFDAENNLSEISQNE